MKIDGSWRQSREVKMDSRHVSPHISEHIRVVESPDIRPISPHLTSSPAFSYASVCAYASYATEISSMIAPSMHLDLMLTISAICSRHGKQVIQPNMQMSVHRTWPILATADTSESRDEERCNLEDIIQSVILRHEWTRQ